MINISIVGANDLSKKHIEKLREIDDYNIAGFYDQDDSSAEWLEKTFEIPRFLSYDELINKSDAIDILSPVGTHYSFASKAIRNLRHVFIKQVLSENLLEARELNSLADEANIQLYVSHHEKFHPNYQLLKKLLNNPFYIESTKFDPNILNYSVENLVFDLLLNELELVLNIVKSKVRKIRASGASLHNSYVDFINVRIEFDNGCVFNMVSGNFESEQKNEIKFFQRNKTYSLNLDNFVLTVLNSSSESNEESEDVKKYKSKNMSDMIKRELEYFASSITNHSLNLRSHYDNYQLLEVAHEIIEKLNINKR